MVATVGGGNALIFFNDCAKIIAVRMHSSLSAIVIFALDTGTRMAALWLPVVCAAWCGNNLFRWLGYHQPIKQRLPMTPEGLVAIHPAPADGGSSHLPDGYVEPSAGTVRSKLTAEDQTLHPSTWRSANELKFSDAEMVARGLKADTLKKQVRVSLTWIISATGVHHDLLIPLHLPCAE